MYCVATSNPGDPQWPLVGHLLPRAIFADSSHCSSATVFSRNRIGHEGCFPREQVLSLRQEHICHTHLEASFYAVLGTPLIEF